MPRLGKRAQALLASHDDKAQKEPLTAEEFLDQGAVDEESGDRWLGSDLAKALRFYQKAYSLYLTAINIGKGSVLVDSYYNASRLLFQVYDTYFKTDGVDVSALPNVHEVTGSTSSVIQPLEAIVSAHEKAIQVVEAAHGSLSLDLLFNTALVYTEVIEEGQYKNSDKDFSQVLVLGQKTQDIIKRVLTRQVEELQKFVGEILSLQNPEAGDDNTGFQIDQMGEGAKEEGYTSELVLQPPDLFETVLAAYKLSQAILESVSHDSELPPARDLINTFLTTVDAIGEEVVNNFSESSNSQPDFISSVSQEQINELSIHKQNIHGLLMKDIESVYPLWEDALLPRTPERYMSAADNIQASLDRYDVNIHSNTDEMCWKALVQMNTHYKQAQELLSQQLSEKRKSSGEGVGQLTSTLSSVLVARSDIDLQRSLLTSYEPAVKNSNILLGNAKTFLKSAMNIANTAGGLRERAIEKTQREKRKAEAVMRLCLLEGKSSVGELDQILGRSRWPKELANLRALGYFASFGANDIAVPEEP